MQGGVVRVRCGLWCVEREERKNRREVVMEHATHTHTTRHAALPQRTGGFWPVSSRPRRMSHESVRRRRTSGGGLHGDRGTAPPLALRRRRAALTLARRQRRSGPRRPAPAPPTGRAEAARCAASWTGRWSAARPSRSAARGRRARRPTGSETRRQSRAGAPNRARRPSLPVRSMDDPPCSGASMLLCSADVRSTRSSTCKRAAHCRWDHRRL